MIKPPSKYLKYSPDQLIELGSQFLISSWSYSKVTSFARNQKGFEMNYIFGVESKNSASSAAGNAYHEALKYYFTVKMEAGISPDIVELEKVAFDYIDAIPANKWKLQVSAKNVDECRTIALKNTTTLLKSFMAEKAIYEDNIKEILAVEIKCSEWITINGVDIPMICNGVIDLVVVTMEDKIAVIDHKSKKSFTPEDEMVLSIGEQAITYVNLYQVHSGRKVDEVWFMENKTAINKDKSPQIIQFKVEIDENSMRLYEALLYESLRAMIAAVSDPDHTYIINQSDNFVDRAELYDFWCRTMISEIEDFNVEESKKNLVSARLKKIRDSSTTMITPSIIRKFKDNAEQFIQYDLSNKNMTYEQKIEHVLRSFGISVSVAHKFEGYSSNTYLMAVSAGVKIASIYSKRLDLANALDVSNVRIPDNLVVYDGKSYVAIDFVKKRDRDLLFDEKYLEHYKIPLGLDNFQKLIYWDLNNHSTPHVLVCGQTGSGKSVLIKNIIEYSKLAGVSEIIIFDPKFEFLHKYGKLKGFEVICDIIEIEVRMEKLVNDMNDRVKSGTSEKTLVVFDEFADAIANSRKGEALKQFEMVEDGNYKDGRAKMKRAQVGEIKSLEENMRILLQKGRSSGFRIVAGTQRASTKVITGDAKVNFPVQICFRVPKEADSRVVIDEPGAESLAGQGDGLIKSPEFDETIRFQAFFKP